jgi:hypothetical protein
MIAKKDLKLNAWYAGCGRGSHVAMWDGKQFHWVGYEWSQIGVQSGAHYDDGGCFAPMAEIVDVFPSVMQYEETELKRKKKE